MSAGGTVLANPIEITGPSGNIVDVTALGELKVSGAGGGGGNSKIEGDTSGNVAEVNDSNQLNATNRQFLSNHKNNHDANITLVADRNHYSTGDTKIDSGVTVTVASDANYYILRP